MNWIVSVVLRTVALALVWGALAGWSAEYALYGVISVVSATAFSLLLVPPARGVVGRAGFTLHRWPQRCWYAVVLMLWFVKQSVRGGVDVALRALRREPDIDPLVVVAAVELPAGHARQLAMLMMNLMPGSLIQRDMPEKHLPDAKAADPAQTTDPGWGSVELHTIAAELDPAAQWAELQVRVGRVFGVHEPI